MTIFRDSTDLTTQVVQAERAWLEAHLRVDSTSLAHLMADEYIQVNNRGELVGKQQVLASFEGGQRFWLEAESDEYQVRIYGTAAVVHGRWRAKGVNSGQPFDYSARYVAVWVYRDDRWQMVSDQSTEIIATSEETP